MAKALTEEIELLISELTCDDVIRCQKARRALVAIGKPAVPYLVEALNSKKQWVRWEAAKALSQIGDPSSTEALMAALEDKEFDVRWLAAEGLAAIGEMAIIPLLRALIARPGSIWLREGAHHVLQDMERGKYDKALLPVLESLDRPDHAVHVPLAAKRVLDTLLGMGIENGTVREKPSP